MNRLRTALARWGGALLHPRATAASLAPEDGARDGLLFILLFAAGAHLLPIGDAVADFTAMAGLAALPTLLSGFTVLIPWLVTTLAVEAILGPQRAHRAALCLLPMLLVVALARLLAGAGHPLPVPKYSLEIFGAVLAAGLALWVRPAVCMSRETATPAPPGRAAVVVGALVVLLPLVSAGRDAADLAAHWRTLAPVAVGEGVPDFHAEDLDGGDFTTADLRGGARLLVFFTSWCGVCSDEMSKYAAVHRELGDRGFAVIGVNCDREGDQRAIAARYRDDKQLPFRIVLDHGAIARAFRLSVYPHLVLVDAHGQIRWVHQGRAMDSTLRAAIAAVTSPAP
ncbi:TlpA family protein disulfide reductase [Nannocystis punicea]|uniref:TlpA disulfide reductase family protein n=1 Tax=Nannocystis punicea TaxID=2995304 RepID=A0ABY7GZP7_9BACT|nr:TlpA disulfide reductase family protein [Nannocystis poenicansa]WAS92403.1 TlpA disulfide reductase family protein [Nannocystis poenicansa]